MTNPPATTPQQALEEMSQQTASLLGDAKALRVSIGEETVTDLLSISIKRHGFTAMVTQATKQEEAKSGADIEIRLKTNSGRVRFVIQAKKLNIQNEKYRTFTRYSHTQASHQIDLLERHAGAKAIALYLLYNYVDGAEQKHWHCCLEPFNSELLGCTVTPTSNIRWAIAQKRYSFGDLHERIHTIPLRCLALCPSVFARLGLDTSQVHYYSDLPTPSSGTDGNVREQMIETEDEYGSSLYNVEETGLPKRVWVVDDVEDEIDKR